MRKLAVVAATLVLGACATQTPAPKSIDAQYSDQQMRQAQQQALAESSQQSLALKRKVAIARMSNETSYGRSLLRTSSTDVVGKQLTDMLSNALAESGNFIVLERPDLGRLEKEAELVGTKLDLVGVDALIIGSLTEFGRKTVGERGFLSATKRQVAYAKVEFRLVDASTGQVFHTASGAGEASIEKGSVAGFGSTASYDATLNDKAIKQAISDSVNAFSQTLLNRKWHTYFLSKQSGSYFVAGGAMQGIKPGMTFDVETQGKTVTSPQTGFKIKLPGQKIATIKIISTFGDTEANEGSVASVVSGSLGGHQLKNLMIVESK
ncbi:MAG: curli production assembly protein CsgG [Gammaproteobacteria bacterium]|nr:MAG: curli production assembly protein CsgG [Gammaproteobacteria bacterium]